MHRNKTITKIDVVYEVIICNMCSVEYNPGTFEGIMEYCAQGGYDSDYLGDGTSRRFSICEKCLMEKLFPQFEIPPCFQGDLISESTGSYKY